MSHNSPTPNPKVGPRPSGPPQTHTAPRTPTALGGRILVALSRMDGTATGLTETRDRILAELRELEQRAEQAEKRLAELESALDWGTSCLTCAKALDSSYAETMRAAQAEALLREMRGEDIPPHIITAAQRGYSMHGAGLVANILAAAWPAIARHIRAEDTPATPPGPGADPKDTP